MNEQIQRLLDEAEIRRLLAIYCFGCDRADLAMMQSVYTDESFEDHGNRKMSGQEFAKSVIDSLGQSGATCSHHLGQSIININGLNARSETIFLATVRQNHEDNNINIRHLGGRYVDRLIKINEVWKISKRICVKDWSYQISNSIDWLSSNNFVTGQQNYSDVGYNIFS